VSVAQIGPVYVPQNARPADTIPAVPGFQPPQPQPAYAGFWRRAVAYLIDSVLVSPIFGLVVSFYPSVFVKWPDPSATSLNALPQPTGYALVLLVFMTTLIYALFESSPWQATPGKRILRLRVNDMSGQRLDFARALGRNFTKMVLAVVFPFAHVLAGLTEKKQGLHDMLAGCLVMRRR
jgi:uncharacterized RDD family membrane protein YckC